MKTMISVIMSVYREPIQDVVVSVESILSQTYQKWEMIIVLDCPKNLEVKKYLTSLSTSFENIHFIENKINLGLGASLNKAILIAKGKYCARMDAEDRSLPDRLEKQISHLNKNNETDLLFCQWKEIYLDGSEKKREPSSADVKNIRKNFFIKSILLHPTLILRTDILKKHTYPEMDRPEDWVLFLDLINLGYRFDLVEEILYEYYIDNREKHRKVSSYSKNLLPHLIKNIPNFFTNPYYWLYFIRIIGEFLISRNAYIYSKTSSLSASIWKTIFRSN